MAVKLIVPLVPQRRTMSCWYASACMVAYYRVQGPRLGIPERWEANSGITILEFVTLAINEGLVAIRAPRANLTEQQLEVFLRNNGPIWCAGYWDGVPHIVVLTGVERGRVYINDPNPARGRRVETLAWFNQRLARTAPNCMMYMPKG